MDARDQARVYEVKLRHRQKTDQPLTQLVNCYGKNIKKIRRGKDKGKGALLMNLKKRQRMSALQKELGQQYFVKQFNHEHDSDQFSSNDVNLQIENEAKNLEQIKLKQEHEAKLLKIKHEYEQSLFKVQSELQQKQLEIQKLKLGVEEQNLGMEHQIEQNILSAEHRVEIENKKENLDFLKKVETLEQNTQAKQKHAQSQSGPTKKIKKEGKPRIVKLEIPKSPLRTEESAQNHASNMRKAREKNDGKKSPFSDPTGKFRTQKLLQKQKN